ncbi:uncharacterized protein K02A2.6-like [Haliotis rufescens]|uniref:uncharacterized protein K02A2.6-like n=1 Tax=Haliotis rufescens TaxID=6454 RepID=UPI00201F88C7|nr:uncharacterized protein K02A2.6-like [Haliotis rufescens]
MVRDRIVFGTSSTKLRAKLINEGEKLTLEKAIQMGQSLEYSQEQLKTMANPEIVCRSVKVNEVVTDERFDSGDSDFLIDLIDSVDTSTDVDSVHSKTEDTNQAFVTVKIVCRSVKVNEVVTDERFDSGDSDFLIDLIDSVDTSTDVDSVHSKTEDTNQAFVTVKIVCRSVKVNEVVTDERFDSGDSDFLIDLIDSVDTSTDVDSVHSKTEDTNQAFVTVKIDDREFTAEYYVVETESNPVLSLKTCLELELIQLTCAVDTCGSSEKSGKPLKKSTILAEYADVFEGIGLFPGKCTIHIDPSAIPVVHPPRKVPVALRERLKHELDRMEKSNIITKVDEPTEWVNSLVIVEKPHSKKLRICLDPLDLNRAIQRPHYPMKTLEDILPSLSKARYFTKLDARSGYWAIRLAEESSFLTTFNTPYGRYRFLRLPFGIRSAQDEFQRRIDECYEGLDGVAAIVDDVLVYGSTPEEHDHNLRNMLSRSRDKGIKLNEEKLEVGVTEIQYFGHILSAEGLRPDPAKVSAICSMNPPRDRSELETILGTVNYLAKFAPNLSQITSPLRQLLPKDVEFVWDHPQSTAFQRIKDIITQTPGQVLAYYDPDKDLTLQVDASKYGLGAALLQDGKPVTYASKSLTTTEVNYAQIEKEMFAILFGCKRFHQYVYGRHVKVESDHKPLISIMKKPLAVAPARLQRMMLQLQKYDLTVEHRPGKEIVVADTLSRKSVPDTYPHLSEGMDAHVHMIVSNVPVSEKRMEDIRRATEADPQFSLLQQTIIDGWPEHRKLCPGTILEFWNFRDQLAFMDGIIFKGQKIVIPKSLRTSMLDKIHTGHMGVEKCLRRARDILFWPKMSNDITSLVLNCSVCLERRNSNPKEPLISHDIPSRPWQTVATDLFLWDTHDFVVVVDYYSRYFEVCKLPSTKSTTVINALKDVFARHGIPDKVISDNGPQYSSQDFAQFAEKWDFVHETSSPRYPQSNGLAEKTVQTIKRIFSKAKTDGRDPHIGILECLGLHLTLLPGKENNFGGSSRMRDDYVLHSRGRTLLRPLMVKRDCKRSINFGEGDGSHV